MRGYDPAMYLELFGPEYGWIIYRDVKLRIHEEKCRKFSYKYYWGNLFFNLIDDLWNLLCTFSW
jgi:hypothetical protein